MRPQEKTLEINRPNNSQSQNKVENSWHLTSQSGETSKYVGSKVQSSEVSYLTSGAKLALEQRLPELTL